ncbi:MAG: energy transducer TonB [Gammaproteobacteria bacterium]
MPAMTDHVSFDHSVSPGIRRAVAAAVVLLHLGGVAAILHMDVPAGESVGQTIMVSFVSAAASVAEPPAATPDPPPPPAVKEPAPLLATERRVVAEAAPAKASEVTEPVVPLATAPAVPTEVAALTGQEGGFSASQPVTPPSFGAAYLNNPRPAYPMMSRRLREQGVTLLRVEVSREGRPQQIIVERSSGSQRLDSAARMAVRDWRFVPAREGDTAVTGWVTVPINWKLEN